MNITGGSFLLDDNGRPLIDTSKYQSTKVPAHGDNVSIDDKSVEKYKNRRISIKSRGSMGSHNFRGTQGSGFGNLSQKA